MAIIDAPAIETYRLAWKTGVDRATPRRGRRDRLAVSCDGAAEWTRATMRPGGLWPITLERSVNGFRTRDRPAPEATSSH